MTTSYPPSIDPADRGNLWGIIKFILTKWLQKTDDMLPATVISYDRVTNRATVQPLISVVTTLNTIIQRGALASIPVYQYGCGGFVWSAPMQQGDLGWIKANDRDISNFLKFLQNSTPNTGRLHNFSNGMFFPDTMFRGVTIGNVAKAVWQNLAGTVGIFLGSNIEMTSPVGIGAEPRAGAALDIQSTTQALGVPAMSSAQKTAISAQAGYTVFDTDLSRLSTYNGAIWS